MFIKMHGMVIAGALLLATGLQAQELPQKSDQMHTPDVVYVGTPYDVVSKMLRLAGVKKEDLVYDLGCGDGRIVVLAAKKYGCRGTGFDIDPERVSAALEKVKRNQVGHLVKIVRADLFKLDFSDADVLSLYLLPSINEKLLPQFEKLKPGSRLVFHDYGLPEFQADKEIRVISNEDNASHTLFLYTTPLKRANYGTGRLPICRISQPGQRRQGSVPLSLLKHRTGSEWRASAGFGAGE